MTKVTRIYERYRIMSQLQLHQLRVAAVAKQICDNLTIEVDDTATITACLLHDMGNIIKFDLSKFPEFLKPQGRAYWETVKQDYIDEYGPDEHLASLKIAKELGANPIVLNCIESVDFGKAIYNLEITEIEPKICDHADLRVGPHGIISIKERSDEGAKRYSDRPDKWIAADQGKKLSQAISELQSQIFVVAKIKPSDITNKSVQPIIEQLKTYGI